jgi:uncharacterized membrane protein YdbT with pleckstrin-like domain
VFRVLSRILDPHVEQYLLEADSEQIIDEVRKHPMAIFFPVVRLICALILLILAAFAEAAFGWLLALASLAIGIQAVWRIAYEHMDRFVITNMRAFRVHGILSRRRATMPMSRILDITVDQPMIGRLLGYGHFVFESAAQDQGLREIRFVGRPDERDRTIQTVIQRAGLRASWINDTES